jgi:hypothetical protein
VFRTYFPTLSALPDFAQSWSALLGLFLSAATSHSAEVSAVRSPSSNVDPSISLKC